MTDLEKAARMALEALERCVATCFDRYAHEQVMSRPEHFVNQAITALRQALEQPAQQEAVGEVYRHGRDSHGREWHGIHWYDANVDVPHGTKLYTSPQPAQQKPVGYVYSVHGERIKNACIASDVPNGTPLYTSPPDKLYEAGWNSALEMAAFRLQNDFKRAFGEDTLASIAVYIKEMKK